MRRFLKPQNRIALGVKVALLCLAHGKGAAMANSKIGTIAGGPIALPAQETVKVHQLSVIQERVEDALEVIEPAQVISNLLQKVSATLMPKSVQPMTAEQIRLFCQAYNAGPYALLKYKGNVPYRETQNYFPRVMKYYQMDLSTSEYEPHIVATATKYGFDPQLIRAIIKTESDFRNSTVSHAGARGLMQVMPVVWKEIKKRYKFDWDYSSDVFDPAKNIEVSCAYLAWLRYDFLPKHFAEFEVNPIAPPALIRDTRLNPSSVRIVASVATVSLPNNLGGPVSSMAEKAAAVTKAVSSDKSDNRSKVRVTVSRASRAVKRVKAAVAVRKKQPELSDKKLKLASSTKTGSSIKTASTKKSAETSTAKVTESKSSSSKSSKSVASKSSRKSKKSKS